MAPTTKTPAAKALSKTQLVAKIAESENIPKTQAESLLKAINTIATEQLGSSGPGVFVLPGLIKLRAVDKPAQPARPGINPFTKQPITVAAKPASRKVRATPMKALKDAI